MLVLFLIATATLHAPGDPVAPAEPIRYRIDQRIESRVDLSMFNQGEQIQTQEFTWFTTVSLSDTAGGRILHAVLDSVHADLGMVQVPAASYDSVRGAVFHGYLDEWGRVRSLTGPEGSLFLGLFEAQIKGFVPRWKPGARTGEQWTDTLAIDTDTPQGSTHVQTVTEFRLGGEDLGNGVPSTRIDASFTATTSGTVQTPAGEADVSGEGSGTATYYVGRDGHLVRSVATGAGDAVLTSDFTPAPIPIQTSTSVTVSRIE